MCNTFSWLHYIKNLSLKCWLIVLWGVGKGTNRDPFLLFSIFCRVGQCLIASFSFLRLIILITLPFLDGQLVSEIHVIPYTYFKTDAHLMSMHDNHVANYEFCAVKKKCCN